MEDYREIVIAGCGNSVTGNNSFIVILSDDSGDMFAMILLSVVIPFLFLLRAFVVVAIFTFVTLFDIIIRFSRRRRNVH